MSTPADPTTAQKERDPDIGLLILQDQPAGERAIDRAGGTPPPPVPPAPRRPRPERPDKPSPLLGNLMILGLALLCAGLLGVTIEHASRGPR